MADRLGVIRRAFVLPADDLNLETLRGGRYGLGDDIAVTLSLLYGIGPNVPRLLTVDDTGALILSAVTPGSVRVQDGVGAALSSVTGAVTDQTPAAAGVLNVNSINRLSNGSANSYDRMRSGSAANLAGLSGLGSVLTVPPGMWQAVSTPAAGIVASATRAAGAAGVRHICAGIIITVGAIAAPVATALTWVLRDGATGVGTILAAGQIAVPAAVFQGAPVTITDISIPGTAATAMTLEFSAALANLLEGVTLLGFDAS